MPLDPSIIGGFRPPEVMSPVNAMAQMYQLRALQGESEKNQLAMEKTRREMAQEETLRNLLAGAGGDTSKAINALAERGYHTQAADLSKKFAEANKAEAELTQQALAERREALRNVTTPEGYAAWNMGNYQDNRLKGFHARYGSTLEQGNQELANAVQNGTFAQLRAKSMSGLDSLIDQTKMEAIYEDARPKTQTLPPVTGQPVVAAPGQLVAPNVDVTNTEVAKYDRLITAASRQGNWKAVEQFTKERNAIIDATGEARPMTPEQRKQYNVKPDQIAYVDKKGEPHFPGSGATNVTQNAGEKLSPGQRKIDERFAEDWIEWNRGGRAQAEANSRTMNEVIGTIKAGKRVSGPEYGIFPDVILSLTKEGQVAIKTRQDVERIAQEGLRNILGAQFGQVEGENFLKRVFDPKLEGPQLLDRLARIYAHMEIARQQKDAMVKYFDGNDGSLKGYKGPIPSVADFEKAALGKSAAAPAAGGGVDTNNPLLRK
jgi:hypothetical protein